MGHPLHRPFFTCLLIATMTAPLSAGNWAQFRGPNATGLAERDEPLPGEVGPTTNVLWKTALPKGHSSPAIFGNRIYLTGQDDGKLLTIALDRQTGEVLWQAEAPHE